MPRGIRRDSLPFGPCTSMLPSCMAIFTPEGTGIGLRPIRDICSFPLTAKCASQNLVLKLSLPKFPSKNSLPDFANDFAAQLGFASGAAAHQAFRRSHDADPQAAYDRTNLCDTQITPRSRPRNPLHASDDATAVRRVLQENAQHL